MAESFVEGIGQYLHVYYPQREQVTLLRCVHASEGHVAGAVVFVGGTVRTESYPAHRFLASSCTVAGGSAGVAPLPSAELAAFRPGLLVQPGGIAMWF
jgi:hypothetical protein